jgi:hypothetical protein
MRAVGGALRSPACCCSRSDRICQIRPSMKPIAIATPISTTINSIKVIGISPRTNAARLLDQRLPERFSRGDFGKLDSWARFRLIIIDRAHSSAFDAASWEKQT